MVAGMRTIYRTPTSAAEIPGRSQSTGLIQRACDCGGKAGASGSCQDCDREKLTGLQPKLTVNQPGDRFEQEADRMAEAVVRGSAPGGGVSLVPVGDSTGGGKATNTAPVARPNPGAQQNLQPGNSNTRFQRQPIEEEEEETLMAKPQPGTNPAGADRVQALPSATPPIPGSTRDMAAGGLPETSSDLIPGGGRSLDPGTRSFMEPHFGHDFSQVRVHTGPKAEQAATSVQARAFTLGRDIVFGAREYDPGTTTGRQLLAHELTHVVQQGQGRGFPETDRIGPQAVGAIPVTHSMPPNTLAGKWRIRDRRGLRNDAKQAGLSKDELRAQDAELLAGTFQEICSMATLQKNGDENEIHIQGDQIPKGQEAGCGCLQAIEIDLAKKPGQSDPDGIRKPRMLKDVPEIGVDPHGWSHADLGPETGVPNVILRYPDEIFQSGYWTDAQKRVSKDLWQLLAHEICGHMQPYVQIGDPGKREEGSGHNLAIQGENLVALEKGRTPEEMRGLDVDPNTNKELPGHRGESFLHAEIEYFAFGSADAPDTKEAVFTETIKTMIYMEDVIGLTPRIQVEGYSYEGEGGFSLAYKRAKDVEGSLKRKVNRHVDRGNLYELSDRFGETLAQEITGDPSSHNPDPEMKVVIYIYHRKHSADVLSPEAKQALQLEAP